MDTITATTLDLPMTAELAAGFAATVVHTAKANDVTPVITAVRVDHRTLTATDRYSVGQYEHTTHAESVERHGETGPAEPDAFVIVPREVAEWIGKQKPANYAGMTLRLTDESATILWADGSVNASRAYARMGGNFPPVARLIPERTSDPAADVSPFGIGHVLLARIAKSAGIIERAEKMRKETTGAPVRFQLAADTSTRKNAPVLATIGRMTMLVQPALILR